MVGNRDIIIDVVVGGVGFVDYRVWYSKNRGESSHVECGGVVDVGIIGRVVWLWS